MTNYRRSEINKWLYNINMDEVKLQTTVGILSSQVNDLRKAQDTCTAKHEAIVDEVSRMQRDIVKLTVIASIGSGLATLFITLLIQKVILHA